MYENWFIKNPELLEENSREKNLMDLSSEIERFSEKLDNIKSSSIVWFIGRFWSWKSNFLNQIKDKYTKDTKCNSKWFLFDAWKYPERSILWENFILEFARQINSETFDKVIKQVDWKINDIKIAFSNFFSDLLNIITPFIPWLSLIKDFIPWLSLIKHLNHFFKTTPAKRNFELEALLKNLIKEVKEEKIYVIVEDIDRSWDNGIFFLETLNYFLKNNEIEKRIIVIVPIWEEKYKKEDLKISYLKSLDYTHEYSLREVKLGKFVEELFLDEICKCPNLKWQITTFLEWIFRYFTDQITMRKLKLILRDANSNYRVLLEKQWKLIDWRLSIVFETAKHIKVEDDSWKLYIDYWRNRKIIRGGSNRSIFFALISCVYNNIKGTSENNDSIYEYYPSGQEKNVKLFPDDNHTGDKDIYLIKYGYSKMKWKKDAILYNKEKKRFYITSSYLY